MYIEKRDIGKELGRLFPMSMALLLALITEATFSYEVRKVGHVQSGGCDAFWMPWWPYL